MGIVENLSRIRERIKTAAGRANRAAADVRLVAVTKTISAERLNEALRAGVADIGENRVQEAEEKFPQLIDSVRFERHLIGHLQSNKARRAVELFDWIESVDSLRLAEKLEDLAMQLNKRPVVLAQVDLGDEPTKTGVDQSELPALASYLASCRHLDFRGLMTIPPFFPDPEAARPYFARLRELLASLNERKLSAQPLTELSMGMSHDFETAIEEGATVVRIGTAIFGERD